MRTLVNAVRNWVWHDGNVDEELKEAMIHIIKVTKQAETQTTRIKWIRHRASCALYGTDWHGAKYPKNRGNKESSHEVDTTPLSN